MEIELNNSVTVTVSRIRVVFPQVDPEFDIIYSMLSKPRSVRELTEIKYRKAVLEMLGRMVRLGLVVRLRNGKYVQTWVQSQKISDFLSK